MYSKDGVFIQNISQSHSSPWAPAIPPYATSFHYGFVWECLSSPKTVSSWGVRTEIVYSSYMPVLPQNTWQHSRYSIFIEWITQTFFCILSVLSKFHPVRVDLLFWKSQKWFRVKYEERGHATTQFSYVHWKLKRMAILKRKFIEVNRQALKANNLKSNTWMEKFPCDS